MFRRSFAVVISILGLLGIVAAQKTKEVSDAEYTKQALSAAPKEIAKDAGIIRVGADGSMKTLRESKNGFTCLVMGTDKMCNDANSMEFLHAMMNHQPPPDKLGISYMLAGDDGASNTDPYATGKTASNHWIVTGPHIMLFGPPSKLLGYPETADADSTKPYMMWVGTPYEHAMIPVASSK